MEGFDMQDDEVIGMMVVQDRVTGEILEERPVTLGMVIQEAMDILNDEIKMVAQSGLAWDQAFQAMGLAA